MLAFSLRVTDSDGGAVSNNPSIVYVMVKHNPNNIGPTENTGDSSNTPGTTVIQPQQLHPPIVLNNNVINTPPLLSNSAPSS